MDIIIFLLTDRNPFWISTLLGAALVTVATRRGGWLPALGRGMAAILLVLCSRIGLFLLFPLTPTTLDVQLYSAEAALGYPAFWTAILLRDHLWLRIPSAISYLTLPLAVAIIWVTSKQARLDFRLFPAIGFLGWFGYLMMPAVGPSAVNLSFPSDPHAVLVAAGSGFRNCMPSLHAAWLIALWWGSVSLPRRWRWVCALYCIFGLIWTLGLGSHYAVDLVVAVPFTYGVRAAVQLRKRGLIYLAIVAAWFIALRLDVFVNHTIAAWTAVVATLICCPVLEFLRHEPVAESVHESSGPDAGYAEQES